MMKKSIMLVKICKNPLVDILTHGLKYRNFYNEFGEKTQDISNILILQPVVQREVKQEKNGVKSKVKPIKNQSTNKSFLSELSKKCLKKAKEIAYTWSDLVNKDKRKQVINDINKITEEKDNYKQIPKPIPKPQKTSNRWLKNIKVTLFFHHQSFEINQYQLNEKVSNK